MFICEYLHVCARACVYVYVSLYAPLEDGCMMMYFWMNEWMGGHVYVYGQQQTGSKVKKGLSKVVVIMND